MKIFYWVMGVLIVGTFLPSVLFLLLHLITGSHEHGRRASALWNVSRVLVLLGLNILIWGHVAVGVWSLIRH
jgi:hypothetical protein